MPPKTFPVFHYFAIRHHPDCPKSIPWDIVSPHEAQALKNHQQTISEFASRGGLDPVELRAVIEDRSYPRNDRYIENLRRDVEYLKSLVKQ